MKLVIVEDSDLYRAQLMGLLSGMPWVKVVGFAVAEDAAVSLITDERPDAVLLDLQLAPGSGIQVLERMRAADCSARVMVISHNLGVVARAACEALGAIAFHDKNMDLGDSLARFLAPGTAPVATAPADETTPAAATAPLPADARPAASSRSGRRQWIVLVTALVLCGAYLGYRDFVAHRLIVTQQREWLTRLGAIVDDNLTNRFTAIYRALDGVRADREQWANTGDRAVTARTLRTLGDAMQGARTVSLLDRDGRALASSRPELVGQDFSHREYFAQARDGNDPARLYVSSPFTTLLGAYAINLTRVVRDPDGRFAGLATATLDPEYFKGLLAALRSTPDGWAAIAHGDGTIFVVAADAAARNAVAAATIGRPLKHWIGAFEGRDEPNAKVASVSVDGREQWIAQRTIRPANLAMSAPLRVVIGRDRSAALAEWRSDVSGQLAGLAAVALGACLALWQLQRRNRAVDVLLAGRDADRRRAADALRVQQRLLAESQAIARIGSWSVDTQARDVLLSDEARRLLGLSEDVERPSIDAALAQVHPDDRPRVRQWAQNGLRIGRIPQFEFRTRSMGGKVRWLQAFASLARVAQGDPRRLLGTVQDITERKLSERALAESESVLSGILDSLDASIALLDERGTILRVNEAWRAFGKRGGASEVLCVGVGLDYFAACDAAARAGESAAAAVLSGLVALAGGRQDRFRLEYRMAHGADERWFLLSATCIRGRERRVVVSHLDITAVKLAQQAERAYAALAGTTPTPMALIDRDKRLRIVNPAWAALAGRTQEALMGRPLREVLADADYSFVDPHLDIALAGRPRRFRIRLTDNPTTGHDRPTDTKRPPRIFDVSCHPFLQEGRIEGSAVALNDVSELIATQQALRLHQARLEEIIEARIAQASAAENRLRLVIESSANGIVELDADTRILLVNPAAADMLGFAPQALIGRHCHEAIHYLRPDGSPYRASECTVDAAVRSGRRLRNDRDFLVRADGSLLPVTIATHPIRDGDTLCGAVMNFVDISERIVAERALGEARLAAEAAAQAKSAFLANMSHEIRTPLNGVLGLAQIGFRDSAASPKARKSFGRILESGELLLTVVNDVLDFAKIEAGKLRFESVPIDVVDLVERAVAANDAGASAKGLTLVCRNSPALPDACLGDPVRVSQILLNLLSNAVKFTQSGEVRVGARPDGDSIVFEVEDTGIGMDASQIARLFQPFEQADGSTTRRFGGTGLGLSISGRLAELMGGKLTARSVPGRGSAFTLRLPIPPVDLPADPTQDRAPQAGGRLEGLRILVAEDSPVNLMVLEGILAHEGARFAVASDGREALETIAREGSSAFDVVLMDVQMPEIDGLEATRQLRASSPGLPVIGQTAHALEEERDRCLTAGMVAVLTKPIVIDVLVNTILSHVPPRPMRAHDGDSAHDFYSTRDGEDERRPGDVA